MNDSPAQRQKSNFVPLQRQRIKLPNADPVLLFESAEDDLRFHFDQLVAPAVRDSELKSFDAAIRRDQRVIAEDDLRRRSGKSGEEKSCDQRERQQAR